MRSLFSRTLFFLVLNMIFLVFLHLSPFLLTKGHEIWTHHKSYYNLHIYQKRSLLVKIWSCFVVIKFCWGGAENFPIFILWIWNFHDILPLYVWTCMLSFKDVSLVLFKSVVSVVGHGHIKLHVKCFCHLLR